MKICAKCGVELDGGLEACPLCETPVLTERGNRTSTEETAPVNIKGPERSHLMRRVLWQITAVLLVSGMIATLGINLAVDGRVTWAIYPITICLTIFVYASLMALWKTRFILHLLAGWLISSLLLLLIDRTFTTDWVLFVAWPMLSAVNLVGILLYFLIIKLRTKGLNVFALVIVALAVLSLIVDGVISFYRTGSVGIGWSVIVAACLLPVTAAILFMYFRTRSNSELQKIFHT